ncbi:adenosylmethionine--8-amino-7-oxononanoate transaminase [Thalassotalea sp. HSM 43]|uniref:adenosylmethionine--8-amino-7-oxononanoate transaminase n=1 Tax=Thalassotalea sp. HSM 43 TaxID=2552945 RepID=UPI0010809374|nr:adenosylmethionine--8-amino-7-oxononanoate transaminase [Thalassotalea sp. HSM 43]QBY06034.1 adenosylmethionine--8-amino-7-oxononanoate transaminase [Thalassotalea sp. HSM 43]
MTKKYTELLRFDQNHLWHPYTSMTQPLASYMVESAEGVYLTLCGQGLDKPTKVIDGMSSWWSVVHGYNHPIINNAIKAQVDKFSHVMFGGLTHEAAIELGQKLVDITPDGLDKVFLADSGSVAVEVAMKMAIQYQHSLGKANKAKFITIKNGYHGDTFAAMSVCDPVNGMHQLFSGFIAENVFADAPQIGFDQRWDDSDIASLKQQLDEHHESIAALILEPVVQGAGGMRFYHPEYLRQCRTLCDQYGILLIADEIATGFGRTGKLFACEHANISPDIMCLGKAITGGYMTLAATLCSADVANTISEGDAGVFMHGPTFMGNPLACAAANASLDLLMSTDWQTKVQHIEASLKQALLPLNDHVNVANARVLGAIGVIEANYPVDMAIIQQKFIEHGVWIRPFGKLIYIMPPFVISEQQLAQLTKALCQVIDDDAVFNKG